jgi:hypothetical protein
MSYVLRQPDRNWSHFQGTPAQLRKVFERFREARLKLNPEKCQLLQKEVWYLGHIVSPKGISTDPEKLEVVREWPTLKNKHEIRSFLGLLHILETIYSRVRQHCKTADQTQ